LPTGLNGTSTTRTITITGAAGTYNAGTIKVTATNACGTSAEQISATAVTVRDCTAAPTVSSPASDQTPASQLVDATYAMMVIANIYSASSVTYQWQSSANGVDSWENVSPGGNSNAYNAPTGAANLGTTYYRCAVTTDCGEAVSKKWKITVIEECTAAPTISSPATDETKITKQGVALPADLSVTANVYSGAADYQWQSSADLSTWDDIDDETAGDNFAAPVNVAGTTYYRCVVTTDCGDATSKVFTVIVCSTAESDAEGNWYCTGDFGTAGEWMTMNLRTKSNLEENVNPGSSNSAYYYPNSSQTTFTSHPEYGLLYTWVAASGRTDADSDSDGVGATPGTTDYQGICPTGWHLPSDYEWNQLEKVIAESAQGVHSSDTAITWNVSATATGNRGTHAPKMKSRTAVTTQATNGTSNDLAANGFDALLVGDMAFGSASGYGRDTYFWMSSSYGSFSAWRRDLNYATNAGVYRYNSSKVYLYSVRCKKN
jgi:uncharacterized protein (TIGR02145 family)